MDSPFVLWNPVADRLLRLGPAYLQPKEWSTYWANIARTKSPCIPSKAVPAGASHSGNRSIATNSLCGIPEGPADLLSVRGRPLKDAAGHGGVIVFSDMTERKRTESKIKLHAAQLEAANKELEAFKVIRHRTICTRLFGTSTDLPFSCRSTRRRSWMRRVAGTWM